MAPRLNRILVFARLHHSTLVLVLILIGAGIGRIGWSGIAEFKYDEAMISRRAIALAQQGVWPASTISSISGIPQPPVKAFLLAIPYAFSRNPMIAVAFQGMLGVITVGLTYWLGRRYFNTQAGLIAALLIAFAPWALFYDRKLWSQNVPVFTALMMIGLYRFVVDRKFRWIVLALSALGLLIGFYLGNVILAGIVVFGLVLFPRSLVDQGQELRRWRPVVWVALGVLLLGVGLIPYAVELGARRSGSPGMEQAVSESAGNRFDFIGQLHMDALVATGYEFHALAGDKSQDFYASLPVPNLNEPVDGVAVVLTMVGMLYIVARAALEAYRTLRAPELRPIAASYGLLALWIVVPTAAWTAFGQMPYPHRYIMAYPSQALALGVLLNDVQVWLGKRWGRTRIFSGVVVGICLGILTAWHLIVYFGMLRFVSMTPINGGYGAPVEWLWEAASQARSLSGPQRLPLAIHTTGDDPEYQGGAAEFDAVLGDLPIYLIRADGMEVIPTTDYVWIAGQGYGHYAVERRSGQPTSTDAGIARQSNGIDLLKVEPVHIGRDVRLGQDVTFTLTWRVWSLPSFGHDYGYTIQLYGNGGRQAAQFDSPFLRTAYWRVGDSIVTTVKMHPGGQSVPAPPYHIIVAMYAYVAEKQIAPVDVLDIAGNPAGQQIVVSLN